MTRVGCVYVALGRPYLVQALHSLRSLRTQSPLVPVCLITNVLPGPPDAFTEWDPDRDTWTYVDLRDDESRLLKTDLLRHTPFERSLFLDCDTVVMNDLTRTFEFLDHWDVAMRLKEQGYAPHKAKGQQRVLDDQRAVHELPHWNSGVMLFADNPRVATFFDLWHRHFRAGDPTTDQVALVEAAFRSSCRILSLDGRWNDIASWGREMPHQKRYVLHYMHHVDTKLARRLLELDALVFGASGGESETARYLRGRQRTNARLRPTGWREHVVRLKRRLRTWWPERSVRSS